jgi:hypothetical protein
MIERWAIVKFQICPQNEGKKESRFRGQEIKCRLSLGSLGQQWQPCEMILAEADPPPSFGRSTQLLLMHVKWLMFAHVNRSLAWLLDTR